MERQRNAGTAHPDCAIGALRADRRLHPGYALGTVSGRRECEESSRWLRIPRLCCSSTAPGVRGSGGASLPVLNPATGETIGSVARAERSALDRALAAADRGFKTWRKVSAYERSKILRKAGDLLRARAEAIAPVMTREHGKPQAEAKGEVVSGADILDWFAEEARRTYGRVIPARSDTVQQIVLKEPVGPVAAFTPWNFPINQAARKVAAALAAGCSVILKGPEETPASCAALVQALADAGLPAGVLNLVYGVPAEISAYLIPHPIIRKVSFTGSVPVGKQLAALAGAHMKRVTMELGGHAPAIVFADADVDVAAKILSANKFRNAGQICVAPTRFIVHHELYEPFVDRFVAAAKAVKVGDGMTAGTAMGPLATARRVEAMEASSRTRWRRAPRCAPAAAASAIPVISSSPPCSPTCRPTPAS